MGKKALLVILALFYPLVVFISLKNGLPIRALVLVLVLLTLLQFNNQRVKILRNAILASSLLLIIGLLVYGEDVFLKLYPVLSSVSLLALFGFSLKAPPSIAERFARLKHADLPPEAVIYCRKVTIVWCVFFILNALIALLTVFLSDEAWLFYNGLVSYIIIGVLACSEFIYRRHVMRRLEDGS